MSKSFPFVASSNLARFAIQIKNIAFKMLNSDIL
jgi:hypothetical protein